MFLTIGDPGAVPQELGEVLDSDEYYFDPERDFLPLARRSTRRLISTSPDDLAPGQEQKLKTIVNLDESIDPKQVDGVWAPVEVLASHEESGRSDVVLNQRWVVQDMSLEPPAVEQFDVTFPVGTVVLDQVNQVAYEIVEDGVVRPSDFLPASDTEPVSSPPVLVRQSLKTFPPYPGFELKELLPAETPLATAGVPAAAGSGSNGTLWLIILVGGGAVLVVLVVVAVHSSARFSRPTRP